MRERTRFQAVVLLALAALAAAGMLAHDKNDWPVPEAAKKLKNPVPANAETLKVAKAIYDDKCAQCHGDTGKGDGPEATMYKPKPADLTDVHMMGEMTDGEIFWRMSEGRDPMPAFKKQLTEEQRWQLVHYLRTFTPKPQLKLETPKLRFELPKRESQLPKAKEHLGAAGLGGGTVQILTPTEGVDFTNYIARIVASVRRNWYAVLPESARRGEKGRVVIQFRIQRNGSAAPEQIVVVSSSGKQEFDRAAVAAIRNSIPFELLPSAFQGAFIDLQFKFFYNLPSDSP